MQCSEVLAALLVGLVFALAPFVSNQLIGVLLFAGAVFWVLLTLSDVVGSQTVAPTLTPIHLVILLYWGIATVATALSPVKTAALSGQMKLTLYLFMFALAARILRSPPNSFLADCYLLARSVDCQCRWLAAVVFGCRCSGYLGRSRIYHDQNYTSL